MRISNLLFCTLVAMIARELPQAAHAAMSVPVTDDDPNDVSEKDASDVIDAETSYVSMVEPESIVSGQFSSRQVSSEFDNNRFSTSGDTVTEANNSTLAFDTHSFASNVTVNVTANDLNAEPLSPDDSNHDSENLSPMQPAPVLESVAFQDAIEGASTPVGLSPKRSDALEAGLAPLESEKTIDGVNSIASVGPVDAVELLLEPEESTQLQLSQLPLEPPVLNPPEDNQAIVNQLFDDLEQPSNARAYRSSPAITVSNPSGFGADNFTGFFGIGYQERTRFANEDDGALVLGMGFGDARENVGAQLSYTVASFGGSRDFGTGGFNAKLHKRLSDEWSVALGWEGFVTTGFVDFEDSIYGSASHIIRTRDRITQPFSRVALTAGLGNGRFRTEDAIFEDRDDIGVFGSAAVRVVEPVSTIVEWTGQDLAVGLSITPLRDVPIVLLPAVRDITGAGDGARFVMGAGISFQL